MRKITSTALAALLLLSVVAGIGMATHSPNELKDTTVGVDNQTKSVYAELTNSSGNVTVEIYGVDDGVSSSTPLVNETVSPTGANETAMVDTSINATEFDEARVVVSGETDNTTAEKIEVGTLQEVAGGSGGGGFDLGGTSGKAGIGIVVVAAVVLILRGRN